MKLHERCKAFEMGILKENEVDALFQHLVDTGVVWSMLPGYRSMAESLIRLGRVTAPVQEHDDTCVLCEFDEGPHEH